MAFRGNYYIGEQYDVDVDGQKVTLYVYFPEDMKAGSTLNGSVYWPGSDGYAGNSAEYKQLSDYYTSNDNVDYVFFSFEKCRHYNDVTQAAIDKVIEQIRLDKNITIDINSVAGFSAGGDDSISHTLNLLHTNPSAEQQNLILYDPYNRGGFNYTLSEDDVRAMQENDLTTFLLVSGGRSAIFKDGTKNEGAFINTLALNDIPIVMVEGNYDHGATTARATYDGWVDYLNGIIELEDIATLSYDGEKYTDKYGYKVTVPYVDENGNVTWQTYKLTELVDAKMHPEKYTSEELASLNYATDCLYGLVQVEDADALKRRAQRLLSSFSALLEVGAPNCSSGGTSVLIPGENAALKKVQSAMMAVRDSFEKEINMLLYAEDEYLNMEAELTKNTNELNNMFKDSLDDLKIAPVALEVNLEEPKKEEPKKTETTGTRVSTGGGSYGGGGYSQPSSSNSQEAEIQELPNTQDDKNEEKPVSEVVNNAPKQETVVPQNVNVTSDSGSHSTVTVSRASTPVVEETQEESMTDLYEEEDYDDTYDAETPSYNSQQPKEQYIEPQIQTNTQVSTQTVNRNKENNTLKTVGILAAAGAVTAAGAYAGKKYLDKKKEEDGEFDYDDDTPSSNDEI